jgi:hypothetical protein
MVEKYVQVFGTAGRCLAWEAHRCLLAVPGIKGQQKTAQNFLWDDGRTRSSVKHRPNEHSRPRIVKDTKGPNTERLLVGSKLCWGLTKELLKVDTRDDE